jgi:octanoyl-[GcvH]:protein N-octanoyltransferase
MPPINEFSAHGPVTLIREPTPGDPALGTALSRALMERVARGELTPTFRLHRTSANLAFAKQDKRSSGFGRAVEAARDLGFPPTLRLAGGRAAVFHEGTLAFAWATPHPRPTAGTRERFVAMAGLIESALARIGIDARVGEVPGEYCPGAFSVNARGAKKIAGIGQRLIKGGAHVGGVLVASGSGRINEVLLPVNEALGIGWDPSATGAVEDEIPAAGLDEAEEAIIAELRERADVLEGTIDDETRALAALYPADHAL